MRDELGWWDWGAGIAGLSRGGVGKWGHDSISFTWTKCMKIYTKMALVYFRRI